jgi:hypothetical protein
MGSISTNAVPRRRAVDTVVDPYSASATLTWESDSATGVTSVDSFSGVLAIGRSFWMVKTTVAPGIDWRVGLTSTALS